MPTSNIDDLLLGGKSTTHPQTPENYDSEPVVEVPETDESTDYGEEAETDSAKNLDAIDAQDEEQEEKPTKEVDDYGNEREPENEAIRERLARQARKHQAEIDSLRAQLAQQGASQDVQQAARDFEYDPEAKGDWQQQLASFVKQTVNSMSREQQEHQMRTQEAQVQQEFESKFRDGMGKFNDFVDVIESLPFQITNPMTLATRAMADPAAFLYAAAKRNPQELERIAKIRDPYAQMTEMGKLEERMRKNKSSTQAPKPLARSNDDGGMPAPPKKKTEPSIEDLIAQADKKKLARVKGRAPNPRR